MKHVRNTLSKFKAAKHEKHIKEEKEKHNNGNYSAQKKDDK